MNWEIISLDNACEVTSSKRVMSKNRTDRGIPFYCSKEIIQLAKQEPVCDSEYISEELYNEIVSKFGGISPKDILLTTRGTLGVPYLVKENDIFYFGDGNLTWLRHFHNEVNSSYVYYYLLLKYNQNFYSSAATTIPFLTINYIKQIKLPLPSRKEQDIIVSILASYDNLIDINRKKIAILEEMALRTYREWFVHFRFPGHESCEFKNGLPKGWQKAEAKNFFDITIGKTPSRKAAHWFTDGCSGVPWVSISDMKGDDFVFSTSEGLTEDAVSKHNIVVVKEDTVLLSFKLTVGRVSIAAVPVCTNEAIAHFKTNESYKREYCYCYLKQFSFETLGSTSSIATALNSKTVKKMPFVLPAIEVLKMFSQINSPIFDEIKVIQNSIIKLQQIRDRLLPQLMSGQLEI